MEVGVEVGLKQVVAGNVFQVNGTKTVSFY